MDQQERAIVRQRGSSWKAVRSRLFSRPRSRTASPTPHITPIRQRQSSLPQLQVARPEQLQTDMRGLPFSLLTLCWEGARLLLARFAGKRPSSQRVRWLMYVYMVALLLHLAALTAPSRYVCISLLAASYLLLLGALGALDRELSVVTPRPQPPSPVLQHAPRPTEHSNVLHHRALSAPNLSSAADKQVEVKAARGAAYQKTQDYNYWFDRSGRSYASLHTPTEAQANAMRQFNQQLTPILERYPGSVFATVIPDNPHKAWQFCQARGWDVQAALAQVEAALSLRHEHHIDTLLDRKDLPSVADANRFLPVGYHGHTKRGDLIFIQLPGLASLQNLESELGVDNFLNYQRQLLDFEHRKIHGHASAQQGKRVDRNFNIYDCRGLGFAHFKMITGVGMKLVKMLSSEVQTMFPETLRTCMIIYAPSLFVRGFKVISHFWDASVHEKITITNGPGTELLLQHIEPGQLPRAYGGTCSCPACLESDAQGLEGSEAAFYQVSHAPYMRMFEAYRTASSNTDWNKKVYGNEEGKLQ